MAKMYAPIVFLQHMKPYMLYTFYSPADPVRIWIFSHAAAVTLFQKEQVSFAMNLRLHLNLYERILVIWTPKHNY